jgi:hypothetical protein
MKTVLIALIVFTFLESSAQNFEWAKAMTGVGLGGSLSQSIALDADGNFYITGYFSGTVDFDPGDGTLYLTAQGEWDIFICKLDPEGNLIWAKKMGGSGTEFGLSIAVDSDGNVYATGEFRNTINFDVGPNTFNITSTGLNDVFISKLNGDGNFIWVKSIGGVGGDSSHSIAVDAIGNIYTTGRFSGTVDFDPGIGIFNLTATGNEAIFVSKLDSDGSFVWAKSLGGISIDSGNSITLDEAGNVYTTGRFFDTADFDPGMGNFNLTSSGGSDVFISKLDTEGNFVWAKSFSGTGNNEGNSLVMDAAGNVCITGTFSETIDLDPGEGTYNLTSAGGLDIFVSKLDADGNFIWGKSMGGSDDDRGRCATTDEAGNVYITGSFSSTADFDPGLETFNLIPVGLLDIFISKLDADGNFLWAKSIEGTNEKGTTSWNQGESIAVDEFGNIYTTGAFNHTADFDPGPNTYYLTTGSISWAAFLLKLSGTVTSVHAVQSTPISIFPNPSSGQFTISTTTQEDSHYSIFDSMGKLVLSGTNSSQLFTIDISQLPNGQYLFKCNEHTRVLQKLY